MERAIETLASPIRLPLQKIGVGLRGTVWSSRIERDGQEFSQFCLKREGKGHDRYTDSEQILQSRINEKLVETAENTFLVPQCYGFLSKFDATWCKLLGIFPGQLGSAPANAMISDTIQPISVEARQGLIDRFCSATEKQLINSHDMKRHCLLRLYLGRWQSTPLSADQYFFTPGNLSLNLDQVKQLQLPAKEYACSLARALAFMNWAVGFDGNDIEFVLAPPRHRSVADSQRLWLSSVVGEHSVWMIDFDSCQEITLKDCVDQIAKSFWRNDRYYPQPHSESPANQSLWDDFAEEYKCASLEFIPTGPLRERLENLMLSPARLITHVIARIVESRDVYIRG